MSHKAFVFDIEAFERELGSVLADALRSGSIEELRAFVEAHRRECKDPYEGDPLDEHWESLVQPRDAHQYGDFALTKFYQPSSNLGFDEDWEGLEETLEREGLRAAILLGAPVGPPQCPFDPGKQGSYFQSAQVVQANRSTLRELLRKKPELESPLARAIFLFDQAAKLGMGLYITF